MNNIKITTLVENTVTAGLAPLIAEHGLSFFIVEHCTEFQATAVLVNEFGHKVIPNTVGHVVEF